MAYQLHFSERHSYDSRAEGITIPAVLKTGGKKIELLAKIDTGASDCLFEREYGEALGLRVEEGVRKTYTTANSRLRHTDTKSHLRFLALRPRQRSTFLPIRASSGMYSGGAGGLAESDLA